MIEREIFHIPATKKLHQGCLELLCSLNSMQIVDTGKYSSLKLVNYMYLIRCIHHLEDIVFVACRIRYQKCTESIPEEIAQNFTILIA